MDSDSEQRFLAEDISESEIVDDPITEQPRLADYADDSDSTDDSESTEDNESDTSSEDEDPDEPPFPGDDDYDDVPLAGMDFSEDEDYHVAPVPPVDAPADELDEFLIALALAALVEEEDYEILEPVPLAQIPMMDWENDDEEIPWVEEDEAAPWVDEDVEDEEPISDVEDLPTPERQSVIMDVFGWSRWGDMHDYEPGTMVYVKIAPLVRCEWKVRSEPYFMGPVMIFDRIAEEKYLLNVPLGFELHVGNCVSCECVQLVRPYDESRIVDPLGDVDFFNLITYVERPFRVEDRQLMNPEEPNSWVYRTFWLCYGCQEATLEREYRLRREFPRLFLP